MKVQYIPIRESKKYEKITFGGCLELTPLSRPTHEREDEHTKKNQNYNKSILLPKTRKIPCPQDGPHSSSPYHKLHTHYKVNVTM